MHNFPSGFAANANSNEVRYGETNCGRRFPNNKSSCASDKAVRRFEVRCRMVAATVVIVVTVVELVDDDRVIEWVDSARLDGRRRNR